MCKDLPAPDYTYTSGLPQRYYDRKTLPPYGWLEVGEQDTFGVGADAAANVAAVTSPSPRDTQ